MPHAGQRNVWKSSLVRHVPAQPERAAGWPDARGVEKGTGVSRNVFKRPVGVGGSYMVSRVTWEYIYTV